MREQAAIGDLTAYLQSDSTSVVAYWQRAVCRFKASEVSASMGAGGGLKYAAVVSDIDKALAGDSLCAYLHYNRGNVYAAQKDYERAIEDYDKAVAADPNLAEAYYNRGLAKIFSGKAAEGIADLSKAGELGLYNAYSIIKKHRAKAGG